MANIDFVEEIRLITLIIWAVVFTSTVPFLLMAAHGHQRSTLMTVAWLALFGFIWSIFAYDSAHTATQMHRPTRLWVNYYGGSAASLAMALVLGWRTWRVMLSREEATSTAVALEEIHVLVNDYSDKQEAKIDQLQSDITGLRDEAVRVSAAALEKEEHRAPISDHEDNSS